MTIPKVSGTQIFTPSASSGGRMARQYKTKKRSKRPGDFKELYQANPQAVASLIALKKERNLE